MAVIILRSWFCLNLNVLIPSFLFFSCTWMFLHLVVPIVSANLLKNSGIAQYQRCVIRCVLSIFPPGFENISEHKDCTKVEDRETDENKSFLSPRGMQWRRARAASFMVVSKTSLQRKAEASFGKNVSSWRYLLKFPFIWMQSEHVFTELVISFVAPLAIAASRTYSQYGVLEKCCSPNFLVIILAAHRIVGPVAIALRAVSEEVVENMNESMHGDKLALLGENHFLPNCLSGAIWLVWGLILATSVGINVSQLVNSMGVTGLIFALALQNYAADIVGSLTLMADKRFSTGDLVKIGSSDTLYIIDKVGILSTSVHCFIGPRAKVYFPNSILVKSTILNESRQKTRRINCTFCVDKETNAKKLKTLPKAILTAVKDATSEFRGVLLLSFIHP